ncbi:MAG TPA: hypothetical protein VFB59_02545, partial [Candidatus Saccharimonadales bacterium]|nr:hypothetical protein [Candidatus Saccharimonadales bacterium]
TVSTWHSLYDGAPCMAPIVEAGIVLRAYPDRKLVNQAIQETFPQGTLASVLRILLNSTVQRQEPGLAVPSAYRLDVCHDAETYFMALFSEMKKKTLPRCDIFTQDNEPLFVRKRGSGTPSAMSLTDLALNHAVYPAFSIFGLQAQGDTWYGT